MSNRRPTSGIAIGCLVANVLVWLPGCYLSLVAWFTKFSNNTPLETSVARAAGITPLLGVILYSLAVSVSKWSSEDAKHLKPVHLLIMSAICAAPLLIYIALKLI